MATVRSGSYKAAPLAVAAFLVVGGAPVQAAAQAPEGARSAAPARSSRARDWALPAALIAGTLAIPAPDRCRWCDRDGLGRDALNGFDRSARAAVLWRSTGTANTLSWVTEFVPVALLIGAGKDRRRDALPAFQAFGTTFAVTQAVKAAAARERPLVHFGGPPSGDANASFFSGHTSSAFAVVFALARAGSDRGDPGTKWVWLTGVPMAAATGYLRVAADRHYATDVLAGAAVGAALGWWSPGWWGHRPAKAPVLVPAVRPDGASLSVSWGW
jgi:membrane-associated phospholipid phosphatase